VQTNEFAPYLFLFLFRFLPHVHGPPSAQNTLLSHMLSNFVESPSRRAYCRTNPTLDNK
jgi:hypothetical protein